MYKILINPLDMHIRSNMTIYDTYFNIHDNIHINIGK